MLCFFLLLQMFKGFDKIKDIQYVYTPLYSSLCGVKLDSNNKIQYLLSGRPTPSLKKICFFFSVDDIVTLLTCA